MKTGGILRNALQPELCFNAISKSIKGTINESRQSAKVSTFLAHFLPLFSPAISFSATLCSHFQFLKINLCCLLYVC